MATLVSPGVDIQVIDESISGTSGPGTIPLIFIATKENKALTSSQGPVSNTVAPGTIKSNAGRLYLITSQRELIQTFGDPIFYKNQGTSLHGYELNEYGLLAAYQYLGISNRAYIVRGDVDLSQMTPSEFEPTNPALSGTYWFDLANTSWGIFKSNGGANPGSAWNQTIPLIVGNVSDSETVIVSDIGFTTNSSTVGVTGNLTINGTTIAVNNSDTISNLVFAINAANIPNVKALALRLAGRSWIVLRNLRGGTIEIGGDSSIVTSLGFDNPTTIRQPKYTVGQNGDIAVLPITGDNLHFEKIKPTGMVGESDPDATGFWFLVGSSLWKMASPTVNTGVAKSPYVSNPVIATIPGAPGDDLTISDGIDSISILFDGVDVGSLVNLVARIKNELSSSLLSNKITASIYNDQIVISNFGGGDLEITGTAAVKLKLESNISGNRIFYAPHYQVPANSVVGDIWIKTTKPNGGANYAMKIYSRSTGSWSTLEAPFFLNDDMALSGLTTSAVSGTLYVRYNLYGNTSEPIVSQTVRVYSGSGIVDATGNGIPGNTTPSLVPGDQFVIIAGQPGGSQAYETITISGTEIADIITDINNSGIPNITADVFGGFLRVRNIAGYSLTLTYFDPLTNTSFESSNSADPLTSLGYIDGTQYSRFFDLAYQASIQEPTTEASPGRLWFNDDFLADIMVCDGDQWFGYSNYFPGTDPQGVIIAGSTPLFQTDGSPLVENDLWLDGSDLENYPRLYRYRAQERRWESIDTTDQTTPFGIVFADARWSVDGSRYGDRTQAGLAKSDFLDPDAPDPRSYPAGILLFNTRASTYNVKEWVPDHFAEYVAREESVGVQYSVGLSDFPRDTITTFNQGRWVTASGNQVDGKPFMGRKAQRQMVIQAIAAEIVSNQEVRSEATFFNLIAAPGYPELIDELITLNTDNKEVAFIIGDTPARLEPTGTAIQNWATNAANAPGTGDLGLTVSNPYVGIYYPWGLSTNTDGSEVVVPPSSIALRTLAYNDQVSYQWFAPAGFNRGLITNAASVGYIDSEGEYVPVILNQGQRDVLYLNKINPLSYIPGRGLVVFGQKTLNANETSALSRINVVRLINYLRYNYDIIAKPFLFEPNDKLTRDQVQSVFDRFTGNLVTLRGVYDFAIVCDESNNTPDRIDRNELWIDVAIQPVKAIEFIYIPIRIRNTGEDLTNFLPGV